MRTRTALRRSVRISVMLLITLLVAYGSSRILPMIPAQSSTAHAAPTRHLQASEPNCDFVPSGPLEETYRGSSEARAMWIWYAEAIINEWDEDGNGESDRQEFFDFCAAPHGETAVAVDILYLCTPDEYLTDLGMQGDLRGFLAEAHSRGFSIHYLNPNEGVEGYGNDWVTSDAQLDNGKAALQKVIDFNEATQNPAERFDGIHLDVEPAEADGWSGSEHEYWCRFYELLDDCRQKSGGSSVPVPVGVDLVTKPDPGWYSQDVDGNGVSDWKDILWWWADSLNTMDYVDHAGGSDGLISKVADVAEYADLLGRQVLVGVETQDLWARPNMGDANTFYEEGWEAMEAELSQVRAHLDEHPSFAGVALHEYFPYRYLIRRPTGTVDVALMIDSSGSMGTSDPEFLRKDAAKVFIEAMQDADQVAVVDFDDGARVVWPLQRVGTDRTGPKAAVESIDSSGGTDIAEALQAGYHELLSSTVDTHKAAVLLTDGQDANHQGILNQANLYGRRGWRVFTIGLGPTVEEDVLRDIAHGTGGRYYPLTDPGQLVEVYFEISTTATGGTTIGSEVVRLLPGQLKRILVSVPRGRSIANFLATWPGSTVEMTLIDPNGRVIRRHTANEDPHIHHSDGSTHELYQVTLPQAGHWEIEVYGADLPITGDDVTVRASVRGQTGSLHTPLALRNFPPHPREAGIYGTVTENGREASGVSVDLQVYDGSSWSTMARTTTAPDGSYAFLGVPPLELGSSRERYRIRYVNASRTLGRLCSWRTNWISTYQNNVMDFGNLDIADVTLASPTDGAVVPLPSTFYWYRRPGNSGDFYELEVYDPVDGYPSWRLQAEDAWLGSHVLDDLPPGFAVGTEYAWTVQVQTRGGQGVSCSSRSVTFSD